MVGSARSTDAMAKPTAKRRHDEAESAFRKAWQLLERIERRLERARADERKRLAQLGDGSGPDAPRRLAQLEEARAEIAQIEGLLTELSELIAGNARASSGQTVKDMANSVAAEIKDEAAEPRQLPTRSRNRHHRPRRKPATVDETVASTDVASPSIALPPPAGAAATPNTRAASVVYRSLISPPAEAPRSDQPADSVEPVAGPEPADADEVREVPPSADDVPPVSDPVDPPVEGV